MVDSLKAPADPTAYNQPDRPTLVDADVAALGQAVLTVTKELWVLTDRVHVLEAVLEKHGIEAAAEIEAYEPDDDKQAALRAEGAALIERVLAPLVRG